MPNVARLPDPDGDKNSTVSTLWLDAIEPGSALDETAKTNIEGSTVVGRQVVTELVPGGDDLAQRVRIIDRQGGGDYVLHDELGRGGMGKVYHARQAGIGRMVAIKRLRKRAKQHDRNRFINEAQVTGGLQHPNIMPVYELGMDQDGRLFYSMRAVMGDTWHTLMPEIDFDRNIEILLRVCSAVAYAHSRGVLHRDLKPHNVMIGDYDEVLVMDWGLAGAIERGEPEDGEELVGTPSYMAPEMARGDFDLVGESTDIYLLGGILLEILTGSPPHHGQISVRECLKWAASNRIAEPTRPIPPHYGEFLDIAHKALQTMPHDRHRDVDDFATAVRAALRHRDSEQMAARATYHLEMARSSGSYDDYARAMFCFEESQALWGGNHRAHDGLVAVRLEYAREAMDHMDLDLAASLLDDGEPDHAAAQEELRGLMRRRPPTTLALRQGNRAAEGG